MQEIEKYIQRAIKLLKQDQKSLPHLQPEHAVVQPFETYFSCSICLNVVSPTLPTDSKLTYTMTNPSMCDECEKLNCQSCIDKWLITSQNCCPNCRAQYIPAAKIPRFTLQSLHNLQFSCQNCEQPFLYKDIRQHYTSECKAVVFKQCPLILCHQSDIKGVV